jgi:hypothetical protein
VTIDLPTLRYMLIRQRCVLAEQCSKILGLCHYTRKVCRAVPGDVQPLLSVALIEIEAEGYARDAS